ncbi:phosphatidate cytidylyltransferase [Mycoplasma sp. M5725]|uniref:Phosphatidate cytidylyltransferase n=1 Tax=Mycoplasma phocimorsus TaxID=3045839 RepID=A0AAJ1UVW1_9MOLU|nr:phosphatidate cytidylyltransferase [Mycoplasma phocimorsus]MDJ1645959.1 phosphatidate cytidylyltransferase [Mycoplasma phocimorsus]
MKLFNERILPAIFMLIVVLIFSFVSQYFGSQNGAIGFGARTFSLIVFSILIILAFFEIGKVFKFGIITQFIIILIALVIFLAPLPNDFLNPNLDIASQKVVLYSNIISKYLTTFFTSWYTYVLVIILYFLLLVRELIINKKSLKEIGTLNSIIYRINLFIIPAIFIILGIKFLYLLSFSNYLIYLLIILIPIISDITGYFVGGLIGKKIIKRGLSPISPKKSWEGAIVSFVISSITIALFLSLTPALDNFDLLKDSIAKISTISVFSIILPIGAILGDLIFSLIKRVWKVKDYSNVFKGHGGLLDRIDSLLVVSSISCILITLISF